MIMPVQRRRGPFGWSPSNRHLGWPSDVTAKNKFIWLKNALALKIVREDEFDRLLLEINLSEVQN